MTSVVINDMPDKVQNRVLVKAWNEILTLQVHTGLAAHLRLCACVERVIIEVLCEEIVMLKDKGIIPAFQLCSPLLHVIMTSTYFVIIKIKIVKYSNCFRIHLLW